jgi:hypothetical protein
VPAIGIVVDDAIVVVEAVEHNIEQGLEPKETHKAMDTVGGAGQCGVFVRQAQELFFVRVFYAALECLRGGQGFGKEAPSETSDAEVGVILGQLTLEGCTNPADVPALRGVAQTKLRAALDLFQDPCGVFGEGFGAGDSDAWT